MAELGEELRRERVRRNLTFKDVEQVLGQVGDIDTFSLRSVTRRKAQATPNLVQSEFVEYQTSKKRMSLETRQRKRQRSIVQERIILGIILFCMALFLLWLFLF
ncbi:MAG: hypothetical protein E6951_07005 [Veillonella parvula]|nr:hypothetical protein [Veillonella parvula]